MSTSEAVKILGALDIEAVNLKTGFKEEDSCNFV